MHESNLHHLIADLTIRRGNWDAYVQRVRLQRRRRRARLSPSGYANSKSVPTTKGCRMTRRLLESARGVIVHSHFMEAEIRAAGFAGPIARDSARRLDSRGRPQRLALQAGARRSHSSDRHLRLSEALQAHRRIAARLSPPGAPGAQCPHDPGGRAASRIPHRADDPHHGALGARAHPGLRAHRGFRRLSGGLRHRAQSALSRPWAKAPARCCASLGLGKAVLVSEIGSFRGISRGCLPESAGGRGRRGPDLRVPEPAGLAPGSGPGAGRAARAITSRRNAIGRRVARRYAEFLEAVADRQGVARPGRPRSHLRSRRRRRRPAAAEPPATRELTCAAGPSARKPARLSRHAPDAPGEDARNHSARRPGDRILEMGAYLQITPALRSKLGYGEVRGCYYGARGPRRSPHASPRPKARRSPATSITSTPKRTASPMPTGISPRCSAAS